MLKQQQHKTSDVPSVDNGKVRRDIVEGNSGIDYESAQVLRRRDVLERLAISDPYLHWLIAQGIYPKPFALSARARGWLESTNDAWITARMVARAQKVRCGDVVTLPVWTPEMELIVPPRRGLRLIRIDEVVSRVRLGSTVIGELVGDGRFPLPVLVGVRAKAWVVHEIAQWLRDRHERRCAEDPAYSFLTQRLDTIRPQTRSSDAKSKRPKKRR